MEDIHEETGHLPEEAAIENFNNATPFAPLDSIDFLLKG